MALINRLISFLKPILRACIVCLMCLKSTLAFAIDPYIFNLGNFDIAPSLRSEIVMDNNLFRRENEKTDAIVGIVSPRVLTTYTDEVNIYQLEFSGTKGLVSATSEDDYSTWLVAGDAHVEVTERHLFDLNFSYDESIQARGTGWSQFGDLPDEPDELDRRDLGLSYQLGASDAMARLQISVNNVDLDFSNNSEFRVGRDYERVGWRTTFLLNALPRTDIILEVRGADFNYDQNLTDLNGVTAELDSKEAYAFIGISWEATALTTGSIRIGRGRKQFSSPSRQDFNEPTYELGLEYAPLTYSIFNFSATQDFSEGIGIGNAVKRRVYNLNWRHSWTERFYSEVNLNSQDDDYVGSPLSDQFDRYSVSMVFEYQRWLDLSVGLLVEDRDSSNDSFSYNRTALTFGFEASF